jgi:hypothetical protein
LLDQRPMLCAAGSWLSAILAFLPANNKTKTPLADEVRFRATGTGAGFDRSSPSWRRLGQDRLLRQEARDEDSCRDANVLARDFDQTSIALAMEEIAFSTGVTMSTFDPGALIVTMSA